jgi:putative CocE/NonD family hydrolase
MEDTRSEPTVDVTRHEDLRIPADGETVAATRLEPPSDGPHPALLMYVPYPRDDVITYGGYDPLVRYLVAHDYEVVVADMVGTGGSTGFLDELFTRREGREPAEIVEWLADREWTTGRIGMFGKSYGGITALDAAAQQPESLEAIVPIHTPYQGWRNAYTHGGGAELLNIGMNWLTLMQALEVKPPSWRDRSGEWADAWETRLQGVVDRDPLLVQFFDNPPHDEYWADKTVPVAKIETPTFAVSGWRDSYTRDTLEYVEAIDAPTRLLMGPWRHTMPHRGRECAVDFQRQAVAWFDHFLKGEETGALDWPEIRYWTEREGGRTVGGGVWRGRDDWPRAADEAANESFALAERGLVSASAFESGGVDREYEFDHGVGISSVESPNVALKTADAGVDDARSLTFETDPFERPFELTGTGEVELRLASSVEDHLIVVRVTDVGPDGGVTPVTHGVLRAGYRDGLDKYVPVDPGTEFEVNVPLQPRSHVFERGHRLRVAVSAAHFPLIQPTRHHGTFSVRSTPSAPSTVTLPGRYRSSLNFDDAVVVDHPDGSFPVSSTATSGEPTSWELTRSRSSGEVRMRKTGSLDIDVPHAERVSRAESYSASVNSGDPTSLAVENELRFEIVYDAERVEVVASNRIGTDTIKVTTRVTVDDRAVLDETWFTAVD